MNTIESIKSKTKMLPSPQFLESIRVQQERDLLESKIRQKEIQFRMLVLPEQLQVYRQTEKELGELYMALMETIENDK